MTLIPFLPSSSCWEQLEVFSLVLKRTNPFTHTLLLSIYTILWQWDTTKDLIFVCFKKKNMDWKQLLRCWWKKHCSPVALKLNTNRR